jgi:hypothetical protein
VTKACIVKLKDTFKFSSDKNFSFEVFNSVGAIPHKHWNEVTETDKIFFNLSYLKSLEDSKPVALAFRYVLLFENSKPVAAYSFQLLNVASNELGNILNLEKYGWLAGKVTHAIDKIVFKRNNNQKSNYIICCGSLFVSGEYGISYRDKNNKAIVHNALPEILNFLKQEIEQTDDVCALMVKDFFNATTIEKTLLDENFSSMPMDPEMIFHVQKNWNTFEDYLESLSAKYRLRTNNSLKKIVEVTIKNLTVDEIEKYKPEINELYLQVQNNASVRLVKANVNYFIELKKNLPEHAYVKAFFLEDKMIAFICGIFYKGNHEAHLIGIDYSLNKSLLLYQNILYLFIKDAIELKSEQLFFGRTALEIKTTVGARAFPLSTYFRMSNSILNGMIKPIIKRSSIEEWTPRNPFKKTE